jgi:DNA-binding XRE family transcriptional regulator
MVKLSLKALRVNANLTQKNAAKELGVSQKTLLNWENGVTYPNQQQIEKICKLYSTTYDCINFLA